MAFTNTWDNTFPPDTQFANQLGLDIRNLKLDISQRMAAFASGTLANRPTPEAVFGNSQNGVLYLATDQGIFYQWNGTAWTQVSFGGGGRNFIDSSTPTIAGNTIFTGMNLVSLPTGFTAMTGATIIITAAMLQVTNPSAAALFQIKFGTTLVMSMQVPLTNINSQLTVIMTVLDASTPSASKINYVGSGYAPPVAGLFNDSGNFTTLDLTGPINIQSGEVNSSGPAGGSFTGHGLAARVIY